jgi:hypothetical protein
MRSFLITATVATAALALGACHDKRPQEPVPPPQSAARLATAAGHDKIREVSEISWFQGTLDEAFARAPCPAHRRPILSF